MAKIPPLAASQAARSINNYAKQVNRTSARCWAKANNTRRTGNHLSAVINPTGLSAGLIGAAWMPQRGHLRPDV